MYVTLVMNGINILVLHLTAKKSNAGEKHKIEIQLDKYYILRKEKQDIHCRKQILNQYGKRKQNTQKSYFSEENNRRFDPSAMISVLTGLTRIISASYIEWRLLTWQHLSNFRISNQWISALLSFVLHFDTRNDKLVLKENENMYHPFDSKKLTLLNQTIRDASDSLSRGLVRFWNSLSKSTCMAMATTIKR